MHSKTEEAARRAARAGPEHDAYEHHVVRLGKFRNPAYGPPVEIRNREEFQAHIERVLEGPDTQCFRAFSTEQKDRQADIYYHAPTNTAVIVPENPHQPATAFRPETKQAYFNKRLEDARSVETSITIEPKRGGIHALYPESLTPEEKRGMRANIQKRAGGEGEPPKKQK